MLTRREWMALAAAPALQATPARPLVDAHVHLFAADQSRFPYHPKATYKPPAQPLEEYLKFWRAAGVDRVVIVHPEPYQDDHRYLGYCFAHEPSPNFFKGTCLFDPIAPDTPDRMTALVKKNPGRIVALRIHEVRPGGGPSTSGAIKERDLGAPEMKDTWRRAQELGMAIQMHFVPVHAPQIGELASQFREVPVILDHLARAGQGTAAEFEKVFKLAAFPPGYLKYFRGEYLSKPKFPF